MLTKEEAEKAYADLIQLRRSEVLIKDKANPGKIEIHHIVPRSCGGQDIEENQIALYAKEHFMAHVYLWIIHHDDQFHDQMMFALLMMSSCQSRNNDRSYIEYIKQSEEYQQVREEHAKWNSTNLPDKVCGKKNGSYRKHWYKDPNSLNDGMFCEGCQPKDWIRGHYQHQTKKFLEALKKFAYSTKGKKQIHNPVTGERRYKLPDEPLLEGFVNYAPKRTNEEKQQISKTLKDKTTNNSEYRKKQYEYYYPMYMRYCEVGFEQMKFEFGYPFSQQNFVMQCKCYIPEFVSTRGKRRKLS